MKTDLEIFSKSKDPKVNEYVDRMHESIEKQAKEISLYKRIFQILNVNYHQDLQKILKEIIGFFQEEQYSSIRLVVKQPYSIGGSTEIKAGIGSNCEVYAYLDPQVEEQLGRPGILYISDTTKLHSIKFKSGVQFPKTIFGSSIRNEKLNIGLIWFACENQKTFTKLESDTLATLIDQSASVINKCIEWNENQICLALRDEVLDSVAYPIFILSEEDLAYSNITAKLRFRDLFENDHEKKAIIEKIWKLGMDKGGVISLNDRNYQAIISNSIQNLKNSYRAIILVDEVFSDKQRKYISLVFDTLSQAIRSPLNLITGSVKMIPLVGEINNHQKEYINLIQHKTENSLEIVDELINIERLIQDNGLRIQAISVGDLINITSSLINPYLKQKRISVINKTINSQESLNLDKTLFTQALANILDFSIGQSKLDGEISINVERDSNNWRITLGDESNGLSQVEVDKINAAENTHDIPSNLLLARRIFNFHGGTFYISSDLGKGNTYSIEIPI